MYSYIKKISIILLVSLVFNSIFPKVSYANQLFKLSDAIKIGINNSKLLKNNDMSIFEKKIAIKEARKAVSDENKKNRRLFEKKPIYNKDFARKTKINKSKYEYNLAKQTKKFNINVVSYKIRELYFLAYTYQEYKSISLETLNENRDRLNIVKKLFLKGKVSKEEVNYSKEKYEDSKKSFDKNVIEFNKAVNKLSSYIEMELNSDKIILEYSTSENYIDDKYLVTFIQKSFENDFSIYAIGEDIKIKLEEINVSNKLYNSDFSSSRMSSINGLLNGGINNIDSLDLAKSYENLLNSLISRWGDSWKPYYEISLVFFTIKIPKLFRSGEFDGVRYLEDARYSLMLKIMQAKQLFSKEETIKKAKVEYMSDLFEKINATDYNYYLLSNKILKLNKDYKIDLYKYSQGLISQNKLADLKEEINSLNMDKLNTLFKLNEFNIEMDKNTNGFLSFLTKSTEFKKAKKLPLPYKLPSTISIENNLQTSSLNVKPITWRLKEIVKGFMNELTFELDEKSEINYFVIQTVDGLNISEKTDIKKGFKHLNITLSDTEDFIVIFYKDDQIVSEGLLQGYGSKGEVELLIKTSN
ncbi:TolC family protein [Helicovermis profundi]|uniref:Uncharacterized protein n=1 Tax=Helicovermis profundi TaxID=3065157 RepID=A0AAU9ERB2_9FIRM|nr:hypothetical protein HLPR_13510 [Clostridia bacterium S502]